MILNSLVVVYIFFLIISLAVGGLAAGSGILVYLRWQNVTVHETRRQIEKYLYLSTSAMIIGILVRLVMVPLWFFMLQSLIPAVPGAMCLTGIHLNVPFYSWLSSSMKLILPGLYLSWLLITIADRRNAEQPFFKFRQLLLVPLIILLFGEGALDFHFLFELKPTPVTCCTAVFDFNTHNIPPMLTENHWYFVILFLLVRCIRQFRY